MADPGIERLKVRIYWTKSHVVSVPLGFGALVTNEPPCGKTNNVVSEQV